MRLLVVFITLLLFLTNCSKIKSPVNSESEIQFNDSSSRSVDILTVGPDSLIDSINNCSKIKYPVNSESEIQSNYLSSWSVGSLSAIDRDLDLLEDSLTKQIILSDKFYFYFPLSQLEDTVLAIINAVTPGLLKTFGTTKKMLPECKLSKTDTIAVYFQHDYKLNNLWYQEAYGIQAQYFWETVNTGYRLYYVGGDSIRVDECSPGTLYPTFFERVNEFINRRRGKDNRASESWCVLRIAVKDQMVQSIEGWYYY